MNPLATIKDVTGAAAGSAVGLAKSATGKAAGAVSALVGTAREHAATPSRSAPQPTDVEPPAETPAEPEPAIKPDEPVNVTEELGLDPAPVTKPKRKTPAKKPVTGIDAAADPTHVDVTPADIAERTGDAKD